MVNENHRVKSRKYEREETIPVQENYGLMIGHFYPSPNDYPLIGFICAHAQAMSPSHKPSKTQSHRLSLVIQKWVANRTPPPYANNTRKAIIEHSQPFHEMQDRVDLTASVYARLLNKDRMSRRHQGCLKKSEVNWVYCISIDDLSDVRCDYPGNKTRLLHLTSIARTSFDLRPIQSGRNILHFEGVKHHILFRNT